MGTNNRKAEQEELRQRMAAEADRKEAATRRVDVWNASLTTGVPTFGDALLTGNHWLRIFCPGCKTSSEIDLRKVDRHPRASIESLTPSLRCSWCRGSAPMPRLQGLHCAPMSRTQNRTG